MLREVHRGNFFLSNSNSFIAVKLSACLYYHKFLLFRLDILSTGKYSFPFGRQSSYNKLKNKNGEVSPLLYIQALPARQEDQQRTQPVFYRHSKVQQRN